MKLPRELFDALRGGEELRDVVYRFLRFTSTSTSHFQSESIGDSERLLVRLGNPLHVCRIHFYTAYRILRLSGKKKRYSPNKGLVLFVRAVSDRAHERVAVAESGNEMAARHEMTTNGGHKPPNPVLTLIFVPLNILPVQIGSALRIDN